MASKLKPGSVASEAARLSTELGFLVTPDMIRWWRKKGYPMNDTQALSLCLRNQERLPRKSGTIRTAQAAPDTDDTDEEPPSLGDIPIEFAADREVKVLHALADFFSEYFQEPQTPEQMKACMLAVGFEIYSRHYGKVIGNCDEVAKILIPAEEDET